MDSGDFFGKKQSGLPEFKMADLVHDYRTLEVARQDAARLIYEDAFWKDTEYEPFTQNARRIGCFKWGEN